MEKPDEILKMSKQQIAELFIQVCFKTAQYSYNLITDMFTAETESGIAFIENPCNFKSLPGVLEYVVKQGYFVGFKPDPVAKTVVIEVFKDDLSLVSVLVETNTDMISEVLIKTFLGHLSMKAQGEIEAKVTKASPKPPALSKPSA